MAFYTRWSGEETVEIVASFGSVQPEGKGIGGRDRAAVTLVKVRFKNGDERYRFLETMKATGGAEELYRFVYKLPVEKLSDEEMKKAMKEAE